MRDGELCTCVHLQVLPKELVNALLTAYLGAIAVVVLTGALTPFFEDYFPEPIRSRSLTVPPFKIPYVVDYTKDRLVLTVPEVVFGVLSLAVCSWYYTTKHWIGNNWLGLAFSLEGIEHLSLGSIHVGVILLAGLFVYDVFWVFCTPVMVRAVHPLRACVLGVCFTAAGVPVCAALLACMHTCISMKVAGAAGSGSSSKPSTELEQQHATQGAGTGGSTEP